MGLGQLGLELSVDCCLRIQIRQAARLPSESPRQPHMSPTSPKALTTVTRTGDPWKARSHQPAQNLDPESPQRQKAAGNELTNPSVFFCPWGLGLMLCRILVFLQCPEAPAASRPVRKISFSFTSDSTANPEALKSASPPMPYCAQTPYMGEALPPPKTSSTRSEVLGARVPM